MAVEYEERASDSPFVERVWRTQNDRVGPFTSIAFCQQGMVVRRGDDKTVFIARARDYGLTP